MASTTAPHAQLIALGILIGVSMILGMILARRWAMTPGLMRSILVMLLIAAWLDR